MTGGFDIIKIGVTKLFDYATTRVVTIPTDLQLKDKSTPEQVIIVVRELKKMLFDTIDQLLRWTVLILLTILILFIITFAFITVMEFFPDIMGISWKSVFIEIAKNPMSIFEMIGKVFI